MATINPPQALEAFWKSHIDPSVSALCNGTYNLPEIQKRFLDNRNQIFQRYSMDKLVLEVMTLQGGDQSPLRCTLEGGPKTVFLVYALINQFDRLRISNPVVACEMFDNTLVASFLHETDHLALGLLGSGDLATRLKNEQYAWAATCEYTLRPMIEVYHKSLIPGFTQTYKLWVEYGRDVESKKWRRYIASLYARIF